MNKSNQEKSEDTYQRDQIITYINSIRSSMDDYPDLMYINLPHDEKIGFLFNVYDENAKKADHSILTSKSIISIVLELTDIKISENKCRPCWTALQIRKVKPYAPIREFFMSNCYICDDDDPNDQAYLNHINIYKKNIEYAKNIPLYPNRMQSNPPCIIIHNNNKQCFILSTK